MGNSFDSAAAGYDQAFTHSVIGRLQRRYVRERLAKILDTHQPKKILEVNCGTGEDALWLSAQNYEVTATDISEAMIGVAKSKSGAQPVVFKTVDLNAIGTYFKTEQFDLIFSNFGGLNCLSEVQLELFFKNASALLSENGKLALVVMPKNTLWEQFYFFSKAKFGEMSRRKKDSAIANVDGESVLTYYYNPEETVRLADYYFSFKSVHPIAFFIPPSYLESFFKSKPRLISALDRLESTVKNRKGLSKYADHYFITFCKR
jgi:ubiquinone/menaquinone biosynthesis C-methylase UbiE